MTESAFRTFYSKSKSLMVMAGLV